MNKFIKMLILWLPLGFLILPFADALFIREYLFDKARYSTLQTYAFLGLALSLFLAMLYEMRNSEHKSIPRIVYKWYIALPLILAATLLALVSISR